MARKTRTIVIDDADSRDAGKCFLLTEMPASQAERWAARALMAMMKAEIDLPEDIAGAGFVGIAMLSLKALAAMPFDEAMELMEEMFACVEIIPDPSKPMVKRRLIEDDIEEVMTRVRLRRELIELHTNFSFAAVPSTMEPAAATTQPQALAS